MGKQFFYEFNGRIFVKAENVDQAERLITDINLDDFLVQEDIFAIDTDYIPLDPKRRKNKLGTEICPSNVEEFQNFKINKLRYSNIFDDFMNGKINKSQLMGRMDQADKKEIKDLGYDYEVSMVNLETKEHKTAKVVSVD